MLSAVLEEVVVDEEFVEEEARLPRGVRRLREAELLLVVQNRIARRRCRQFTQSERTAFLAREERERLVHALSLGTFKQRLYATLCVRGYFPDNPGHIRCFVKEHELTLSPEKVIDFFQSERKQRLLVGERHKIALARALRVPALALLSGLRHYRELVEFLSDETERAYIPIDPTEDLDDFADS